MVLDGLLEKERWLEFYAHREQQVSTNKAYLKGLSRFIESGECLEYAQKLQQGQGLSAPRKILINKTGVGRKRIVYSFGREETYVLSMVAFLLKEYDKIFAPNLYSFRNFKTAKSAFQHLSLHPDLQEKYVYRSDISAYFNSVNVQKLLPKLEVVLAEDPELYRFLRQLLEDDRIMFNGALGREAKGIIPGAPTSSFLANLYLSDLDYSFYDRGIYYIRYADDILILADTEEELRAHIATVHETLASLDLGINPDKEHIYQPGAKWEFLGFSYENGKIDISEVSLKKIKDKLRRKTAGLKRWADRKDRPGEYAAKALVKRFNQRFYSNPVHNELTWARWYFPIINTTDSLETIDHYEVDCIRYLVTGRRTKKRFDYTYEQIKSIGFRSLVNEYYKWKALDAEEKYKPSPGLP